MAMERRGGPGWIGRKLPWPLPSFFDPWRILEPQGLWQPAAEMYSLEDKLVVRVELPGVKREDIQVSVQGDVLIISGERSAECGVKSEDYYGCERCYGSFSRTINIPTPVERKYTGNLREWHSGDHLAQGCGD